MIVCVGSPAPVDIVGTGLLITGGGGGRIGPATTDNSFLFCTVIRPLADEGYELVIALLI